MALLTCTWVKVKLLSGKLATYDSQVTSHLQTGNVSTRNVAFGLYPSFLLLIFSSFCQVAVYGNMRHSSTWMKDALLHTRTIKCNPHFLWVNGELTLNTMQFSLIFFHPPSPCLSTTRYSFAVQSASQSLAIEITFSLPSQGQVKSGQLFSLCQSFTPNRLKREKAVASSLMLHPFPGPMVLIASDRSVRMKKRKSTHHLACWSECTLAQGWTLLWTGEGRE